MATRVIPPETKTFPLEDRLRICRDLDVYAQDTFEQSGGVPDRDAARMLLAGWGRSAATYSAALLLAKSHFGDQVAMLARALFEGTIDAYWIAKQPAEAQRLATLHYRQTRLVVAEHWNANERRDGDPALPLFSEDIRDRAMLAKQFGSRAQKHWTSLGLFARTIAVEEFVPTSREGELRARYEEDNKLANLLLHGSAMALNDRIAETLTRVTIRAGPSNQHLANALRHAYWSYQRLVLLLCNRCAPHASAEAERLYEDGWPRLQTLTSSALKNAGRNGPCPCASGRKTKDCHGAL
jgi:hypothetical protein